jgi:hypothetical protein
MAALLFLGRRIQLANRRERKSPACEMLFGLGAQGNGPKIGHKKQGRRRNIPSTTLPAPDIEIGSRHPVNFRMPGICAGMCEPVHKGGKKLQQGVPRRWKISRCPDA